MGNFGAKSSQKGYDVKFADDRFLTYSSSFPTLKVLSSQNVTTTIPSSGGADNVITITHNLGYYAPFIVMYNGSTTIGFNNSYLFCDSDGGSMTRDYYDNCKMSINDLKITITDFWDSINSNFGDTVSFTVYIFIDDFTTFDESIINTDDTVGSDSANYGVRISKDGKDVKTCANVDCILTSSFFSDIVDKKGVITSTSGDLYTISHGLGYLPSILAYFQYVGESAINYERINIYDNQFTTYLETGEKLYYVILKNKIS